MAFLKKSHPDKINDLQFIRQRSELAALAYSEAIQNGQNNIEAGQLANAELFRGLHFSKYDTLVEILSEEFSDTVSEKKLSQYAQELLPLCENIFSAYDLHDSFADSPEYENLYTELTGKIVAYGL
jgi:nitrate/nitrite-specific signal transduction histidine kinase